MVLEPHYGAPPTGPTPAALQLIPSQRIERSIRVVRGEKVLLDKDLADLYEVSTKRLNEVVRRHRARFPDDFMFQLTPDEAANLRSQSATSSSANLWGGRRTCPYAFTEHGVIMAASVLNSERAVLVSVMVVRAFVRLRQILATHADLATKLEELEQKYDAQFKVVFDAIRALMVPEESNPTDSRRIGFRGPEPPPE